MAGEDYKSRDGLLRIVDEKEKSLFYDFFEQEVIPYIEKEGIDLVGISVCDQKQLVQAMILSSMIKEKYGGSQG